VLLPLLIAIFNHPEESMMNAPTRTDETQRVEDRLSVDVEHTSRSLTHLKLSSVGGGGNSVDRPIGILGTT
jgi:hypothetical protein